FPMAIQLGSGRRLSLGEVASVLVMLLIVMALLLPATQSARESARRAHTADDLKQIRMAIHNYESLLGPQAAHEEAASTPGGREPRKSIYNADVTLNVANFARAETSLLRVVTAYDGYVAHTNVNGTAGSYRSGVWKIRVPVDRFDQFVADVVKL